MLQNIKSFLCNVLFKIDMLKHMLTRRFLFLGAMLVSAFQGCQLSQSLSGKNINNFYINDSQNLNADVWVYHQNENQSKVYLRFIADKLQRSETPEGTFHNYGIKFRIFDNYSSDLPTDSGNIVRKFTVNPSQMTVLDSFQINSRIGLNAVVELVIRDFNSGKIERKFVDILRSKPLGLQDVRLFSSNGDLQVSPFLAALDSYNIIVNKDFEQLYMRYYDRSFPTASPPFAAISAKAFDFKPDKIIELKKVGKNMFRVIIDRPGFYQLTGDLTSNYGATWFFFDSYFPEPKTLLSLVEPLRYVTTNEEFDALNETEYIKKEVDAYWLKVGDNPPRAKELIKAYYSRVQWSNQYFTSYLEGWKSDRGMCYIVFGPPDVVYRSTNSETWLYGEPTRYNALSLTFTKVVNPFSANDFRLNRSISLKNPWYRAVEFWRQGRVVTYR